MKFMVVDRRSSFLVVLKIPSKHSKSREDDVGYLLELKGHWHTGADGKIAT